VSETESYSDINEEEIN